MTKSIRIALAGNPNCGKTALFNALTGADQRVGNWPGVTVDKKEGRYLHADQAFTVVDLPGVYSLTSQAENAGLDSKIAANYLTQQSVDVVVNVLDATNLERHLYLTTQLLELGLPVVVAVNMLDILKKRKGTLDLAMLQRHLGCPVVGVIASQQFNIAGLKQAVMTTGLPNKNLVLPEELQASCARITPLLKSEMLISSDRSPFVALQLLERDYALLTQVSQQISDFAIAERQRLEQKLGEDLDIILAELRYQFCHNTAKTCIGISQQSHKTLTERLDAIVLNRWLGIPVFLFIMYCMFFFAVNVGGAFQDFFDIGSTAIFIDGATQLLNLLHSPAWLTAILANGLGKGINTTITFIPMIAGLFLFLSFLEDSGYMARAAFVMDRFMRTLGLPGESFIPMIIGFGCNVPAVMGTRTLANPRDRILTVLMMPFMSCGARFAIFTVFVSAFFQHNGAIVIFGLYLLGIFAAMLTGFLFRRRCLSGEVSPLVLELPHYHRPQLKAIFRLTVRRVSVFVKRAGRVIIPVCVLLGSLNALTFNGHLSQGDAGQHTILSSVGRVVTPVLSPMGVRSDNWPATVGLMTGVLAKEVVVGTLNTLYSQQANLHLQSQHQSILSSLKAAVWSIPTNLSALGSALINPVVASAANVFMGKKVYGVMEKQFASTAAALAYLVFVLLYFPCISTLAIMRREIGKRWAAISMTWSCVLAYGCATLCYQLLTLRAHVLLSFLCLFIVVSVLWLSVSVIERLSRNHWLKVVV